ncbi:hypothetical protein CO613_08655 [Lysobacteraceae bacterium NML07-0707]|nr:hypothetical protein CO613_08655 [Xanthomonadaceae bacterium NML07-0707]
MSYQSGLLVVVLGLLSACTGRTPEAAPMDEATAAISEPPMPVHAVAQPPAPGVDDGLGQTIWRLLDAHDGKGVRITALRAKPGIPLSLVFANGRVQVRNTCNHMGGDYLVGAGGAFAIDKLQRTERICPDKAEMAAEDALYAVLEKISSIELSKNGSRLQLGDEAGNILSFEAIPVPQR